MLLGVFALRRCVVRAPLTFKHKDLFVRRRLTCQETDNVFCNRFQLHRRCSTMSSSAAMPPVGRLGPYEIKGLLFCFLHIVKTLSEGECCTVEPFIIISIATAEMQHGSRFLSFLRVYLIKICLGRCRMNMNRELIVRVCDTSLKTIEELFAQGRPRL